MIEALASPDCKGIFSPLVINKEMFDIYLSRNPDMLSNIAGVTTFSCKYILSCIKSKGVLIKPWGYANQSHVYVDLVGLL